MFRRLLIAIALVLAASPAFARDLLVIIDISDQVMSVRVDGVARHRWPISTGRKGYATPRGTYHPIRMHKMWYSTKYDYTPMPHSIFFRGGYAIHGTAEVRSLGRPASHGCVRLHPRNAAELYALVLQIGRGNTTIRIRN